MGYHTESDAVPSPKAPRQRRTAKPSKAVPLAGIKVKPVKSRKR